MSEADNFALVPTSSAALEKAEPGAKRILSGMVAETLALAKKEPPHRNRPLRIVMVNDESCVLQMFDLIIRRSFRDVTMLMFDNAAAALEELSRTEPDLLITDDKMPGMKGDELCRRLLARKVTYPIIVDSAWGPTEEWVREFASRGLNVSFLALPCDISSLRNLMAACLKTPCDLIEKPGEITPQPRKTRPPRIIILDDEAGPRRSSLGMLKNMGYQGEEILEFEDARDAWQELSRSDPDLFITDIQHVGISCKEMLTRLAERKVNYPILVISAVLDLYEQMVWVQDVRRDWRPNLNVSFLSKPWTSKEFRTAVETALQVHARRTP